MTENHPITPPPELVEQWRAAASNVPASLSTDPGGRRDYIDYIAIQAARWGADQEMDACLEWFSKFYHLETWRKKDLERFRAARRPKPPSLKEQALAALAAADGADHPVVATVLTADQHAIIRRALEALDD